MQSSKMCRLVRLPSSSHVSEVLGVLEGDAVVLLLRGDVCAISVTSVVDVPSSKWVSQLLGRFVVVVAVSRAFTGIFWLSHLWIVPYGGATQQNDPALHRGSEHFGSGQFLVLLQQVNTSWRHENKDWLLHAKYVCRRLKVGVLAKETIRSLYAVGFLISIRMKCAEKPSLVVSPSTPVSKPAIIPCVLWAKVF